MIEHRFHITIGLDCETLRFLSDLFLNNKQVQEAIAAGDSLKASSEALQAALDANKGAT